MGLTPHARLEVEVVQAIHQAIEVVHFVLGEFIGNAHRHADRVAAIGDSVRARRIFAVALLAAAAWIAFETRR